MIDDRDIDAGLWAASLGLGNALFKGLAVGDRFVFNRDDVDRPHCVLIKASARRYRHEVGGRQFETGAHTACWKIAERAAPKTV